MEIILKKTATYLDYFLKSRTFADETEQTDD